MMRPTRTAPQPPPPHPDSGTSPNSATLATRVLRYRSGSGGSGGTALSIEEKYDEVKQLIAIGKEKGYLLYDEVNELLPADIVVEPA